MGKWSFGFILLFTAMGNQLQPGQGGAGQGQGKKDDNKVCEAHKKQSEGEKVDEEVQIRRRTSFAALLGLEAL